MSSPAPIRCPFCDSAAFPDCCIVAQHEHELHVAAERRKLQRARELLPVAAESRRLAIDFIARLADAWDCRGDHVLRASGVEHRALLQLASLPLELAPPGGSIRPWSALTGEQRQALFFAAKAAIQLARECAWIFGGS